MASSCLITLAGIIFDATQIFVSLADEITNIFVMIQFWHDGKTTFFGLCLAVMIISSIISAIGFVVRIEKKLNECCRGPDTLDGPLQWILATALFVPLGPILPTLNFIATKLWPEIDRSFGTISTVDWNIAGLEQQEEEEWKLSKKKENRQVAESGEAQSLLLKQQASSAPSLNVAGSSYSSTAAAGAAHELFANGGVKTTLATLSLLDNAVIARFGSMLLLNIQALSSSCIQAIIQLVAASVASDGKPTTIQTVSLLLSLVSIGIKSFQLARSGTLGAFVWKIAIMCFDLFATVFIFSVFLSSSLPDADHALFGVESVKVTKLTAGWIYTKTFCLALNLCACLIAFGIIVSDTSRQRCVRAAALIFGFLLLAGPAMLAQDIIKLSYLFAAHQKYAPSSSKLPVLSLLHTFLWSAPGESNALCRLQCGEEAVRPEAVDWAATFEAWQAHAQRILQAQLDFVEAEEEALEEAAEKKKKKEEEEAQQRGSVVTAGRQLPSARNNNNNNNDDDDDDDSAADVTPAAMKAAQRRTRKRALYNRGLFSPVRASDFVSEAVCRALPQDQRIPVSMPFMAVLHHFQQPAAEHTETVDDALARARLTYLVAAFQRTVNCSRAFVVHPRSKYSLNTLHSSIKSRLECLNRMTKDILDSGLCKLEYREFLSLSDFASSSSISENVGKWRAKKLLRASSSSSQSSAPTASSNAPYTKSFCEQLVGACKDLKCSQCRGEIVAAVCAAASCFVSTIFGILFPIIATALYAPYFTSLQIITSALCLGSLLIVILLCPAMLRYQITCMLVQGEFYSVSSHVPAIIDLMSTLPISIISATLLAEQKEAEKQQLDSSAMSKNFFMPEDALAQHVMPFLDSRAVGLYGLTKNEYRDLTATLKTMRPKTQPASAPEAASSFVAHEKSVDHVV